MTEKSLWQCLTEMPYEEREKVIAQFTDEDAQSFLHSWSVFRRPSQGTPLGDWRVWLILAGRGWGKTRSGAEFIREQVDAGNAQHIALVGPTAADVRDTMIEGESGLLGIYPEAQRPRYEP